MANRHIIRKCQQSDRETIYYIINESAKVYQGVIPADCYHQPYMSRDELAQEMKRVSFYGREISNGLVAVMGIEPIQDVTLIRHAYVLPQWQRQGIGSNLLKYLKERVTTPRLLVGTWADAYWALDFYQKHGFTLLPDKDELLNTYWDIPRRQVETSVVLGTTVLK
ncbi:MAG: GNAT family N-acetyltransferase [Dehalococcoidales bacterium]|nr:MAG: GNAT family N-acetyltransferase [Dehalococcoidales bacterium]